MNALAQATEETGDAALISADKLIVFANAAKKTADGLPYFLGGLREVEKGNKRANRRKRQSDLRRTDLSRTSSRIRKDIRGNRRHNTNLRGLDRIRDRRSRKTNEVSEVPRKKHRRRRQCNRLH